MDKQIFFTVSAADGHATPFGTLRDQFYMQQALSLAVEAGSIKEVPIGAVIVNTDGTIIGKGFNCVESQKTQTAHAEISALAQAGVALQNWRLAGCWVYVTLEPCSMCIAAMRLSRVAGVVYGAYSPLYGYRLDNVCRSPVYNNDTFVAISGVCLDESTQILKDFFKKMRISYKTRGEW